MKRSNLHFCGNHQLYRETAASRHLSGQIPVDMGIIIVIQVSKRLATKNCFYIRLLIRVEGNNYWDDVDRKEKKTQHWGVGSKSWDELTDEELGVKTCTRL